MIFANPPNAYEATTVRQKAVPRDLSHKGLPFSVKIDYGWFTKTNSISWMSLTEPLSESAPAIPHQPPKTIVSHPCAERQHDEPCSGLAPPSKETYTIGNCIDPKYDSAKSQRATSTPIPAEGETDADVVHAIQESYDLPEDDDCLSGNTLAELSVSSNGDADEASNSNIEMFSGATPPIPPRRSHSPENVPCTESHIICPHEPLPRATPAVCSSDMDLSTIKDTSVDPIEPRQGSEPAYRHLPSPISSGELPISRMAHVSEWITRKRQTPSGSQPGNSSATVDIEQICAPALNVRGIHKPHEIDLTSQCSNIEGDDSDSENKSDCDTYSNTLGNGDTNEHNDKGHEDENRNQNEKEVDEGHSDTTSNLLSLPLQDLTYPIPLNCQTTDVTYVKNRLRFKLEKIRSVTRANKTVLDSSYVFEQSLVSTSLRALEMSNAVFG